MWTSSLVVLYVCCRPLCLSWSVLCLRTGATDFPFSVEIGRWSSRMWTSSLVLPNISFACLQTLYAWVLCGAI